MGDVETTEEGNAGVKRGRLFKDRRDAGRQLAPLLEPYRISDPVVLALPRGGVPVGYEVARHLDAPLRAFPARKIGAPGQPELGIGAVAPGGILVLNEQIIREIGISQEEVNLVAVRETAELNARLARYWGSKPALKLLGRTVILVDDGLATGSTASAALRALRKLDVGQLVLAVPICAAQTVEALSALPDAIICVLRTENLSAVGLWYDNFEQTADQEVEHLLALADKHIGERGDQRPSTASLSRPVSIQVGDYWIEGDLNLPQAARALVLFAHGSGSSRHSERNRQVARLLNEARFGTLLIDLLTPQEETSEQLDALKFNIPLLAERLVHAVDWIAENQALTMLPLGLFGASTGAAAALLAALERTSSVRAVVSRGGRVDLAGRVAISKVTAPTLLIVGELDRIVLDLNKQAKSEMQAASTEIEIVSGASHLFPEPGALDEVARLAVDWFSRYLSLP